MRQRLLAAALAAASFAPFAACTSEPPQVCDGIPNVAFSKDPTALYPSGGGCLYVDLRLACAEADDVPAATTVCMTLDGTDPDPSRASTYCLPAPVREIPICTAGKTCLRYYLVGADGSQGSVQETCYTVAPPPVVTCEPGSRLSNQDVEVSLRSSKEKTTIVYTTDGTDPDPEDVNAQKAPAPVALSLSRTTTVKFIGIDEAGNVSARESCTYQIDKVAPITTADPTPEAAPAAGNIALALQTNESATIYYTTDGSTPDPQRIEPDGTTQYALLQASTTLTRSAFVTFYAVDMAGNVETPTQELVYHIGGKPAVGVNPSGGFFAETAIDVTLRAAPANEDDPYEIWYTTNGDDPARNGSTSTKCPGDPCVISDFDQEGEYELKYIAVSNPGAGTEKTSDIHSAVFLLGVTAPPFFREYNFTQANLMDAGDTDLTVEMSTAKGYARLRRVRPTYVGGTNIPRNDYATGLEARWAAVNGGSGLHVYYAMGSGAYGELREYVSTNLTGALWSQCFPMNLFFNAGCGVGTIIGPVLGVSPFIDNTFRVNLITPWTAANNQGGIARWTFTYGGAVTRPWTHTNQTQFAQVGDAVADEFYGPQELPKSDSVVDTFSQTAFIPRHTGGQHTVWAYEVTNGTQKAGTTPPALSARATALATFTTPSFARLLGVGTENGKFLILNQATLATIATIGGSCPTGVPCRVNSVSWVTTGGNNYALLGMGYYSDPVTGQVAVVRVDNSGNITGVDAAALPTTDDFAIRGPVEAIRVATGTNVAVAAIREQGIVLFDLTDLANLQVHSRGFAAGRDFSDTYFTAVDIDLNQTGTGTQNRILAVDGATYQTDNGAPRSDGGFRVFELPSNVDAWETTGEFVSTNINGAKRVSSVTLEAATPDPLDGVTVKFRADGVDLDEPVGIGNRLNFDNPPLDLRFRLIFSGDGSATKQVKYLKFKMTPVE